MSLSEDMFIFVSSFVFGYCVGYYSYDFFEAKSVKDEIIDFILSSISNMELLIKKIEQIKISDEI